MVMSGHLTEKDGIIRFKPGHEGHSLPGTAVKQPPLQLRKRDDLARAYPLVERIIGQRGNLEAKVPESVEPRPPFLHKVTTAARRNNEIAELFAEYDELVRDVGRSRYPSFQANLKRWLRFLDGTGPFAAPILQKLEAAADFPTWFEPYRIGMFGMFDGLLEWPEQKEKALGTQLLLMRQFATDSVSPGEFAMAILRTSSMNESISQVIDQIFQPLSAALRRYLQREIEHQPLILVPTPPAIPTADGYVTLDHNSPQYREAEEKLDLTIQAVIEKNDYPDQEDKEQRLGELSAGRTLFRAARIRVAAFVGIVMPTLVWLVKTFAGDWVGKVAELAWKALKALLGIP